MSLWFWLSVAALLLATYLSTVKLALLSFSPSALQRRMEERGREPVRPWVMARLNHAVLSVSLLTSLARLAFFVLVLVQVVGIGEQVPLTWGHLGWSMAIAALLLWLFSVVVSAAIARHGTEGVVLSAMPLLAVLTRAFYPLTRGLAFIDEIVRRLLGAEAPGEEHAEAELLRSIEDTQREGGLDEEAAILLENVVEFRSTDVAEVMTPRIDMEGIELTDDLVAIRAFLLEAGHSRIPVYRENLDNILGILYVKDLLPYLGEDASDFRLEPILRRPIVVPQTKPVQALLGDFQRSEVHMAIVVDEYGGTAGLVTIEDVLEEIVGEIHDEHEPEGEEEPTLQTIEDNLAEVDGRYHIDDLNERLGLDLPEDDEYDTVGGFILARLGRVPAAGESLESHDARFTALEATPTQVQRVRVEMLRTGGANGERRS